MANILKRLRKQSSLEQVSFIKNFDGAALLQSVKLVEDLECGPWTTRKIKIPTSASGYLIIEYFGSAEGKRLKGLGKMEPEFFLSNLKLAVPSAVGFDELKLFSFPDNDPIYTETDFMSQVVNYPERGHLLVALSLKLTETQIQCTLLF